MREVNFSIPSANKASVSITTALYDRRALDCTSNLPLINSLNNLAYLTTSSGRIRDILTVDGGVERLVCILKEGRSKDMMEMWKWNLAFQCIVNIGVRGSEAVRTRVVEADMVPVIATILDNYFQVLEKCRERAELESKRKHGSSSLSSSRSFARSAHRGEVPGQRSERSRRHVPPPIAIPEPQSQAEEENSETTPTAPIPQMSLSSPPERTVFEQSSRIGFARRAPTEAGPSLTSPPLSAVPLQSNAGQFGVRSVRDTDRLPSMLPTLHGDLSSQPQSPTTPNPGPSTAASAVRTHRPSIRHQLSISGSDDGGAIDDIVSDGSNDADTQQVDVQPDIVMQDIVDDEAIQNGVAFAVSDISTNEDETFNITHRTSTDGSAVNPTVTPTQGQAFPPAQIAPAINPFNATPPNLQQPPPWMPARQPSDRPAQASILAAMPRDEDVLMSLQLLAYVSKYCNLRSYFQQTHLVPRLKVGRELRLLDQDYNPATSPVPNEAELEEEWDNEFVEKPGERAYNIFPLIEKFTAKPSSSRPQTSTNSQQQGDMQYWAGVVMRNLCRKDDSRGGIRQCAYWQCGKWEEYTRQFAKCRRCRRTKQRMSTTSLE
ncbi:hypothetical protein AMS68_000792 [Peltaster fructicola]|uniref:MYND-type zinc finger protein MUB1 n=1 Tax=Peltaster fructicola TaxID=286661 RepID=A0A6H0XKX6_9PEZI|nr:hypothetical protein AMS68_000792 [Peltaster fructicola]